MVTLMSSPMRAWEQLKVEPLNLARWQGLLDAYCAAHLVWQAMWVARQMQRLDAAAVPRLDAQLKAQFGPVTWQGDGDGDAVLGLPSLDDASAQLQRFSAWLVDQPEDWLTWLYVTRLHDLVQPLDASAQAHALAQAQRCEFIAGESAHWLGLWRMRSGDAAGALTAFAPLANVLPLRHGSMMYLGEVLLGLGNTWAAEKAFTRASLSNNPLFLSLLADRVFQHNYSQEAMDILQKALSLAPDNVSLWLQLAKIQSQVYALADCRASMAQLRRLGAGQDADLLAINLEGQYGDAKTYLQKLQAAYEELGDGNSRLISSVLMTSLYQDDWTPEQIADLHKRYCQDLGGRAVARSSAQSHKKLQSSASKVLRVGYVTGDLHRQHPVNIFMLPLLQEQKKSPTLEVFIYHTGAMFDAYTERARACADRWVEAAHWDDETLQREIARDQIDVLVDLAGHTSSHRLGVFWGRPAPVQATFLGYPHSTGLPCMDFIIGDAVVSPPEHAHLFTEKIARVDGSVFCWSPVDEYPLPPPRDASAPVVFASFNNALKLSPKTLALWAKVLHAVPDAKLLLKTPSLRDEGVQERFRVLLLALGIGSERVEFRGPSELSAMMQEYGDVDIALDPLGYNGGTTSLQAMWMGVPLVTLEGGNFAGRMGSSFLQTLARKQWVAHDESSYVDIARQMAADVPMLRMRRAELREAMRASPLCDIEAYARSFERALHSMR